MAQEWTDGNAHGSSDSAGRPVHLSGMTDLDRQREAPINVIPAVTNISVDRLRQKIIQTARPTRNQNRSCEGHGKHDATHRRKVIVVASDCIAKQR